MAKRPRKIPAEEIRRVFLLSPANCNGRRAQMVMSERAQFALARQLRTA